LNENFPAYHLFTAFLASNLSFKFSRQTQKKLVGFSHYGHFSKAKKKGLACDKN
jgi:hypothetical protein